MEQLYLTANDYKTIANKINKQIDFLNDNKLQTFDIDFWKNNQCIYITVCIDSNEMYCTNIQTFNMDNNIEILSNFVAKKLEQYITL